MPKSNGKSVNRSKTVYLDYASATPVLDVVSKNMQKIAKKYFANASAIHALGVETKKLLENERRAVAHNFSAHADEIIFTSGATESNNLAILGYAHTFKGDPIHIITTNIEHASVLEVCKYLEQSKIAEVTFVEVQPNGVVDPKDIKKAMRENTVLVSVMYANNEIGTIQPIREIAKEIRHFNKINNKNVCFHTDATQAINYLDINVERLGVDMLSMNAAKIYGPKGVGVLFKKRNIKLASVLKGGDQEFGLRSGTENIVSIVGLSQALSVVCKTKDKESKRLAVLRDLLVSHLKFGGIILNGDESERLPNNVNITVPHIPSDLLVIELSARGVMASSKSACKSGDGKASHVIRAINKNIQPARAGGDTDGSIRFSLGRDTNKADIIYTVKALKEILTKLEKWYH